jgi:hypothetical protein
VDDIFAFDVFAHEDGLCLKFVLRVGKLEVVSGVDLGDMFRDFEVVLFEDLV